MEKEIFQIHSRLVLKEREKDNYIIKFTNDVKEKDYVTIYFSSNGIYYPNNSDTFVRTIIQNNRFEWTNNTIKKSYKHIFIRDLFKQWYLEGINPQINSIESLLTFLKRETEGKKIITVGSSAGGYASILFGTMLNAKKIFAFAPQVSLYSWAKTSDNIRDPLLFKYLNNRIVNQYFDLSNHINKSTSNIFYFAPFKSDLDAPQINIAESLTNIKMFKFNSSRHGVPITMPALVRIINNDTNELLDIYIKSKNKILNPVRFSVKISGIFPNALFACQLILKKLKK